MNPNVRVLSIFDLNTLAQEKKQIYFVDQPNNSFPAALAIRWSGLRIIAAINRGIAVYETHSRSLRHAFEFIPENKHYRCTRCGHTETSVKRIQAHVCPATRKSIFHAITGAQYQYPASSIAAKTH